MKLLVLLLGMSAPLLPAPAVYSILPIETPPAIDGNLQEWTEEYFIDSLRSDDNIICRDNLFPWTRGDFQYMVWAAHDANKVYFGLKSIADDALQLGSGSGCDDSWKINPGGQATSFPLFFNGTLTQAASCPFALGSTLFAFVLPTGNGNLPTAEFSLDKAVIDPYGAGAFKLCVGFEEGDTPDCMDTHYGGIGVEYTGNKQDWNSNPWNNPVYYPIFNLAPIKVEKKVMAKSAEMLTAFPNPFVPATTLSYNVKNSGFLTIYDMAGKVVKSFMVKAGTGSVEWKADGMASGIYVVRLKSGNIILNTRLFLTR